MGLLDTTMEMAKLAGTLANPELVQEAMKANKEALELSRENLELQKRVAALEEQLRAFHAQEDLSKMLFRNGDYVYREGDPIAHCPRCWDARRQLIHLHQLLGKEFTAQNVRHSSIMRTSRTPVGNLQAAFPSRRVVHVSRGIRSH
jgi:hypothetical protein